MNRSDPARPVSTRVKPSHDGLRVRVQGGRIEAVYDDRLSGLIERLGGVRAGDGAEHTADEQCAGSHTPRDGSRPARGSLARRTDLSRARLDPAARSCRPDSWSDDEPRESTLDTSAARRACRPPCTSGSSDAKEPEVGRSENTHHAAIDAGSPPRGDRRTFPCHVEAECSTLRITRASFVEPGKGGWTADMGPSAGPVLGPFGLRSEALRAERQWLRRERGL